MVVFPLYSDTCRRAPTGVTGGIREYPGVGSNSCLEDRAIGFAPGARELALPAVMVGRHGRGMSLVES
jgi:hypothetical protein